MISSIYLENVMCYRGQHELLLEPKAYGVFARKEDDPARSNFLGKTALFEAIGFAITGRFPKERRFDADGWITEGEKKGAIHVCFEDGHVVTRERIRGQATQTRWTTPMKKHSASQAEAQTALEAWLGWGPEDFVVTSHFEQRKAARLVLATPEERFGIVTGWLGLGKVEDATAEASCVHGERVRAANVLRDRVSQLASAVEETRKGVLGEVALAALEASAGRWRKELDAADEAIDRARRRIHATKVVGEYDEVVARGKALAAEVKAAGPADGAAAAAAEEEIARTSQAQRDADANVARRRKVACGEFDGRCPVADITCPAKAAINADRATSKRALAEAQADALATQNEHAAAWNRGQDVLEAKKKRDGLGERLVVLREHAEGLLARARPLRELASEPAADPEALVVARQEAQDGIQEARAAIARNEANAALLERQGAELARLGAELEAAAKLAAVASRGRAVFRAAHRAVSERALGAIGADATDGLAELGSELRVEVRWEREGKDPARTCEECGAAFLASARAKECARCGAARGLNVVQKLEFLQSARSGAADDLAGIHLQLAAASFLLASRGSPWSTALIDEPFGQLDQAHRRALARQLASALPTRYSFRQAFVISHDPATLDVLPGRIQVTGMDNGSKVEVVA